MASSLWKFTAVVGVIGIGVLVVLQAQRGLSGPGDFETPGAPSASAAPEVIGQAEIIVPAPAQGTALPNLGSLPALPPGQSLDLPGAAAAPGIAPPERPAPFRRATAQPSPADAPEQPAQVAMNPAAPFGGPAEESNPFGGPNPFAEDTEDIPTESTATEDAAADTPQPEAEAQPEPTDLPAEFPTPVGPPPTAPEQPSGQPAPAEPDDSVFLGGPPESPANADAPAPPPAGSPFDPYESEPAASTPEESKPADPPFEPPFGTPPAADADPTPAEAAEPTAATAEPMAGPMLPAPGAETILDDTFEAADSGDEEKQDSAEAGPELIPGPALPPTTDAPEASPEPTPDPAFQPEAATADAPTISPNPSEPPGRATVDFPDPPGTGAAAGPTADSTTGATAASPNPFENFPAGNLPGGNAPAGDAPAGNPPASPAGPVIQPRFPVGAPTGPTAAAPAASAGAVRTAGAIDVPGGDSGVTNASPLTSAELTGDGTVKDATLDGSERPQLTIEKIAPPRAVLGEPMVYEIVVRNGGQSTAHQVVVEDQIPQGARLTGTIPQAELLDTTLRWKLGALPAGQSRTIKVRVIPTEEGRIGSVAKVNFVAEVAARTEITSPRLSLELTGPEEAALGSALTYRFQITNTGETPATGVMLRNLLPKGLEHPGGNDLEYEVGMLEPGKTQEVSLTLTAVEPGRMVSRAIVTAEGGAQVETTHTTEVRSMRLSLSRTGPKRRLVGREAEYVNTVTNATGETMTGVQVVEQLPPGVKFVATSDHGRFDPATRTVAWNLPDLPPRAVKPLTLRVVPETAGTLASTVTAVEPAGGRAEVRSETVVEGFAALRLNVDEMTELVEVGQQFTLRFVAHNRGTAPATDVRMEVAIPAELQVVQASGASEVRVDGQRLLFAPVPTVEQSATYDVVFKAVQPGMAKIGFQLASAQLEEPLRRDEPVRIVGK